MFMLMEKDKRKCTKTGPIANRGVNWSLATTYKNRLKTEKGTTLAYYIAYNNQNIPSMIVVGEQKGNYVYNISKVPLKESNFAKKGYLYKTKGYIFEYDSREYMVRCKILN